MNTSIAAKQALLSDVSGYSKGFRASRVNEAWHGDITEIKTASGKKFFLYLIMDNFSRKIMGLRLSKSVKAWVQLLKETRKQHLPGDDTATALWTDEGGEICNTNIDDCLAGLNMIQVVARKDVPQSNSMIESVFLVFKKLYMEYDFPDCRTTLTDWFVEDYNSLRPHVALKFGQTPDEAYSGIDPPITDIQKAATLAREKRKKINRTRICEKCE